MASTYSKARLHHALRVFRENREEADPARGRAQHDYQLRRVNAVSNPVLAATWDDDDDASSDEYSPSAGQRRRPVGPKTPKAKRLQPVNPLHTTAETTNTDILPLPSLVTLKLHSHNGKALLNTLAGQYGTGYETKKDDEGGSGSRRQPGRTFMEMLDEQCENIDDRTTRSGLRRKDNNTSKMQGCSECEYAKQACSTKTTGTSPCNRCQINGFKCAKYEPPEDEKDAEDPRSKKDPSALSLGSLHSQPTQTLSVTGERPIDELRRYYVDVQAMLGQNVLIPGNSIQNPITLDSSPTPEAADPTFFIKTPFAHPIEFKSTAADCHFCRDFRYGVFGYGPLTVEVARMADGQFLEVANGHLSKGKAQTRMCVLCGLKRLYIFRCRKHTVSQYFPMEDLRIKKYMAQLLDKEYPSCPAINRGVYYTCSLCAKPALWRCVADQTSDLTRCKIDEKLGKGKGCGLFLCQDCAEKFQADGGVLKRTTAQNNWIRADMEFLFAGSLLHRAFK